MSLADRFIPRRRRSIAEQSREDYYTASQGQLVWQRFKSNRTARIAFYVLVFFIFCGLFAPFLSPYDPSAAGRNADYTNGAPQIPQFCDANGCSLTPFITGVERYRGADTNFRWVTRPTDERNYLTFLPRGSEYRLFGLIPMDRHLFGVQDGFIHIFGTDAQGKDIFSRSLHAIGVSLAVGSAGVLISFVLALIIGGVAGYFGGWIDTVLQMMDTVKTVPTIPLFMAVAAFIPDTWSAEQRFFFISLVLGLLGWGTLARRIRTHVLAERTAGLRARREDVRSRTGSHHSSPPAALVHELHHRRSGDLVSLHGAGRNIAELHRPGAEGPGELARRDASERDAG
jgi:peptide/nickel transport system permease protein